MAVKEDVKSALIYIRINRGKDAKENDIILKAFKLPVASDVDDKKAYDVLKRAGNMTNFDLVSCNLDVVTGITEQL